MRIFTIALLCFISLNVFAQKDKVDKAELSYAQKAAEIKAKIWGDNAAEFDVKVIPESMKKESAVIIAKSVNIQQTTGSRLKFFMYFPTSATRTNKVTTYRERVKINDKVALDAYSSLSYQRNSDESKGFLYVKFTNKMDTYIGVKIIKPNGKEVIVNTGEEVLIENNAKNKQGKLAIPELQVGDIIDYYISTIELVDGSESDSGNSHYLYLLAGEYPILNYQLNFQFNKKVNVYYINANGAPAFTESTGENDDKIYNLKFKDIPKFDDNLWSSPLRQFPYVELAATYTNKYLNFLKSEKDKYNKDKSRIDNFIKDYEDFLKDDKYLKLNMWMGNLRAAVKEHYKTSKELKAAPLDSTMRVFYDWWKQNTFNLYFERDMVMTTARNTRHAFSRTGVYAMARYLLDMEVDFDILLVASRNKGSLEYVMEPNDIQMMIRVNGDKPLYMACDDRFTHFNEIPKQYQGEEAIVLTHKKNSLSKFEQKREVIPVVPSKENYINSQFNIAFVPDNMSNVKIERTISEGGSMRHADQQALILPEQYDEIYKKLLGADEPAKRIYSNDTKKAIAELKNQFEQARQTNETNFKEEIKGEFGQEPLELTNYKVNSAGVTSVNPVFTFTGTFVMNNFVKSAGGSYIFEVGKLLGTESKIDDSKRQRKTDVYMPAARTITHNITIDIPKGYQVKGVEELNHQEKNTAGEFTTTAKINGDKLFITANRIYNHNFEKAAQWPLIVAILDSIYNFSTQKILFEKM
ncbi:DUF3857 domain-containing protein [Mucilaginibacter sp. HMF5004]|uniref:DUF3857 domain-containing protein n=1 Tax=Mucilaginibacter rivuli TaxID=2857527 RepID=UPI001C5E5F28|nr:DUF3857 domain-containing protein [Mucilaginibacter rivuli]MBW4888667.1 DUF3857 domain-containing protein [Mucilaginibacter rivuli]